MSTFHPTKFVAIFFIYFVEWNLTTCGTKLNLAGAPTNFVRWKFNIFFVSFFLFYFYWIFFNGFQNKKFFITEKAIFGIKLPMKYQISELILCLETYPKQKEKKLLMNENVIW